MKRAIVLVLDGVGIGELPDADKYRDRGSNTLAHVAQACGGLTLPVLEHLGLGNIAPIQGIRRVDTPDASYGKMAELSPGKDSTTGHWELFGVVIKYPFPTYPNGFPEAVINEFETRIGHKILGNKPASGTEIIQELGELHVASQKPIVYTSADSVLQIACHIDIFPLKELYQFCMIARELMQGDHAVARVIARPFAGKAPRFYRTPDRKDFSLMPPEPTLLDIAKNNDLEVTVIGKIDDLFGQRGFTRSYHSVNDWECVELVLKSMSTMKNGLIVANFVQFDMDWGHRNDAEGFKKGLIEIDKGIGKIIDEIADDDILIITADHGNDPTTPSTDHSREYVPLLVKLDHRPGKSIGVRSSFSDVAKTIARYLSLDKINNGKDFLDILTA